MAQIALPSGSSGENAVGVGIQSYPSSIIDSLANGGTSSSIVYSNTSGNANAKVVIDLASIDAQPSGNIRIDNGTDYYEVIVATGQAAKRIEFNTIPATFLASFTIKNNLGVAFASGGNSIAILPI